MTSLKVPGEEEDDPENEICETVSHKYEIALEMLISRLSFSHIKEITVLDDPFGRFFYELECIKWTWSVRESWRQIDSKLFYLEASQNGDGIYVRLEIWNKMTSRCIQCKIGKRYSVED